MTRLTGLTGLGRMASMNTLTTYWLCRAPGCATEGPFTLGQLRAMHGTGAVNAASVVCRQGEQDWLSLDDELGAVEIERGPVLSKPTAAAPRQPSFEESMRRRDAAHANGYNKAINWITALICLTGAVPVLGLLAYVLWGGWALVATVLCVMQMSKGQTSMGIQNLIGVWILAPLVIAGLQMISLSLVAGQ